MRGEWWGEPEALKNPNSVLSGNERSFVAAQLDPLLSLDVERGALEDEASKPDRARFDPFAAHGAGAAAR